MQATPIERLARLAAQRTARTDRLAEAVCALLDLLSPYVEAGDSVTVRGCELHRTEVRTNIGAIPGWEFEHADETCDLDRPVSGRGYRHGDFSCPWRGPSRADLIAFASRAGEFVEALIVGQERENLSLETAQQSADTGLASAAKVTP
jgi:hypothetical protein